MPTSSHVINVIRGGAGDPKQCKRPFPVKVGKLRCLTFPGDSSSIFPDVTKVSRDEKNICFDPRSQVQGQGDRKVSFLIKKGNDFEAEGKGHKKLVRRKRHTACHGRKTTANSCGTTSSKKEANFTQAPTERPCLLPSILKPASHDNGCGDASIVNTVQSKWEKPRSLIDKAKESVSSNKKSLPSIRMRKTLPPSSLNTVVFSLKHNEDYTYRDIMNLIYDEIGVQAFSVQYDPVQFRVGRPGVSSRWIVKLATLADTKLIIQKGFEMNGENVVVKLFDTVSRMEVET